MNPRSNTGANTLKEPTDHRLADRRSAPRLTAKMFAVAVFGLVAIAGCTSLPAVYATKPDESKAAQSRRQMMSGWWVEQEPTRDGHLRTEVKLLCPNGQFFFDFRLRNSRGNLTDDSQEVGDWGISGPVYFTIARGFYDDENFYNADPAQGYFYDAYQIYELTYDKVVYRHYENGDQFTARRLLPDA